MPGGSIHLLAGEERLAYRDGSPSSILLFVSPREQGKQYVVSGVLLSGAVYFCLDVGALRGSHACGILCWLVGTNG